MVVNFYQAVKLLTIVAFIGLAGCASLPQDDIGSQKLSVSGHIIQRVFPGPPEFEDTAIGDKPIQVLVLVADQPVKNTAGSGFIQSIPPQGVSELQLQLNEEGQYERYVSLIGRHVRVRGTCFWAHTGGHYTPLLIKVKDIHLSEN